jgi:hypothetical protein
MNSSGDFILNPFVNGSLRDHLHYKFNLEALVGSTIDDLGWIPVSEFSSRGIAVPAGAIYGYNLFANDVLRAMFPPIPVEDHYLEFVGDGLHEDSYILDEAGIWWMDAATTPAAMLLDPNWGAGYDKYFVLWMTKLNMGGSYVASLQPDLATNVLPVKFRNVDELDATSGVLYAYLDQVVRVSAVVSEGATALKEITGVTAKWGPIISRIFPGQNVVIDSEEGDEVSGYYGACTITAGATGSQATGVDLVSLNNAEEDMYGVIPVITLPEGRSSSILCKASIPTNVISGRQVKLTLDIIGPATAASQSVNISYIRITAGADIPLAFSTPVAVSFDLVEQQFTRIETANVAISAGDTVYFKVEQPMTSPVIAYPILRLQATITKIT